MKSLWRAAGMWTKDEMEIIEEHTSLSTKAIRDWATEQMKKERENATPASKPPCPPSVQSNLGENSQKPKFGVKRGTPTNVDNSVHTSPTVVDMNIEPIVDTNNDTAVDTNNDRPPVELDMGLEPNETDVRIF
jgi:hypothetical protein